MPTFVVVLEGEGINMPSVPEPIIGFVTTRRVKASDEMSAIEEAKRLIINEWRSDLCRDANIGDIPTLEINSIRCLGFFERLLSRAPNKGYTFYSK